MNEILFHYEKIDPTTWTYLASLLIIGLFFKFGRFWSVRNLDLLLLILLAPGLLLVSEGQKARLEAMAAVAAARQAPDAKEPAAAEGSTAAGMGDPTLVKTPAETAPPPSESDVAAGVPDASQSAAVRNGKKVRNDSPTDAPQETDKELSAAQDQLRSGTTIERIGFIWLLVTGLLLLVRCLIDSTMVRRPLLEPNMTTGGLTFSCCSLFVFLMANVVASRPTADDLLGPSSAERLISRQATDDLDRHGPGYALVFTLPSLPTVKMGSILRGSVWMLRRHVSVAGSIVPPQTSRWSMWRRNSWKSRRTGRFACESRTARSWRLPSKTSARPIRHL